MNTDNVPVKSTYKLIKLGIYIIVLQLTIYKRLLSN